MYNVLQGLVIVYYTDIFDSNFPEYELCLNGTRIYGDRPTSFGPNPNRSI